MSSTSKAAFYSPKEEAINVWSHAIGVALSVIALILLINQAIAIGDGLQLISFVIFGVSLIVLYSASTLYHRSKTAEIRSRLRVFDHASIYVFIAGTYTPFSLITLNGTIGWIIFGLAWGMAAIGITIKLFFTGRFKLISTLMYVFMGWMIIFFINPLMEKLSHEGFIWLAIGGVFYTVGAVLYSIKKIPFNHAIFHVCVLFGSFSHFMAVYFHVLPLQ